MFDEERLGKVFELIVLQLLMAGNKHKKFSSDLTSGLCVIAEELGELAQAINDCTDKSDEKQLMHIQEEAAHVAVTAIRFICGLKIRGKNDNDTEQHDD